MNRFGTRSYRNRVALMILCISAFGLFACAPQRPAAPPPPPPPAPETPADVEHQVSYSGETLGMIASWYTGSASNWKDIAEANPGLRPERLRLGQTIVVPSHLVSQREPMPKRFVTDLLAKTRRSQPVVAEPPADAGLGLEGDTVPGGTTADPSDLAPKKGAAVTDPGTIPDIAAPPPPVGAPTDPTATKPPTVPDTPPSPPAGSDTEREKLLDELLAQ